jgi:hypothetical protein
LCSYVKRRHSLMMTFNYPRIPAIPPANSSAARLSVPIGKEVGDRITKLKADEFVEAMSLKGASQYVGGSLTMDQAREIRKKVNDEKEGEAPLSDENVFLYLLHYSLSHFNSLSQTLFRDDVNAPKNQKSYFKTLSRVSGNFVKALEGTDTLHSSMLLQKLLSYDCPLSKSTQADSIFSPNETASLDEVIEAVSQLQRAADDIIEDLGTQGKKGNDRSDLYMLVELLDDVLYQCSGSRDVYTYDETKKAGHRYSGHLFRLCYLIYPHMQLNAQSSITENSIGEGISLLKKAAT